MIPKAVYLSSPANPSVFRVFSEDLRAGLAQRVDLYPTFLDKDNVAVHEAAAHDAIFAFSTWGMPAFSEEEIRQYFPQMKVLFYAAGSVQNFARPFLNRGIQVISAAAANAVPVAEYTTAQILLANKGFYQNTRLIRTDRETARVYSAVFPGNHRVKVGLLGAGAIGSRVITLLKPFDLEVLVFDPFLPDGQAQAWGVKKTSLDDIFTHCQTISNHLANLPATRGMINKDHFSRMLPNATFINTGRGAQVIESDLVEALRQEPGRTAVLDVTDPEPPLPDSPLLSLDNVFLTTHIAGSSGREVWRMAEYVIADFDRYLRHEPMQLAVTLKMLETMA